MANTPTTHYGFLKPAKSDLGWWSIYSANFDAIDAALAAIQAQIDGILHTNTLHADTFTMQNSQGAWVGWNRSIGIGEIDFVCHRGNGAGGFFFEVTVDGATFFRLAEVSGTISEQQTSLLIARMSGGVTTLQRVTEGDVNTGGAGYRTLRIPN